MAATWQSTVIAWIGACANANASQPPHALRPLACVQVRDASAPVYATVAIGPDGTATLAVPPATGSVA